MKRCRRHYSESCDPYEEFNFEESLRKYQICPQKKIKLRNYVQSPHQDQVPLQPRLENYPSITKQSFLQHSKPTREEPTLYKTTSMNGYGGFEPIEKNIAQEIEAQKQNSSQIEQKQEEEQPEDRSICNSIVGQREQKVQEKVEQRDSSQLAELSNQNEQLHDQQQSVELHGDHEKMAISDINNTSRKEEREMVEMMGEEEMVSEGRLKLSGNVYISLRTLDKHREQGWTQQQLLDQLLKQRTYLSDERQEVAFKLRRHLHHN